ncbi:hypothetical protein M446_0843 [Methylobacterium sp. 4-46]|uniref:hypothetical protein n=1 Tax=unclassified Methylobacterium TaxID=2615210 RepID=UPI000152C981|nr:MULTISPECIES: hypothetical protein [Methylobacterium]ACA15396.1 hypothetical protein M446_0843 [Methylobacterium sp. 4-46]WFT81116.1 hypothetical protein QA634_04220 [Methylobacterium nodulans]
MRARAVGLVLAPLLLAAGAALAQPSGPFFDEDGPAVTGSLRGEPGWGYYPPRTGPRVCQKWCEADLVPCDPPNFKIADGRCRPNSGGRF